MTDKQKLQSLFDAALKDPSLPSATAPTRAFPTPVFEAVAVPAAVMPAAPVQVAQQPMAVMPEVPVAAPAVETASAPTMAALLDDAASAELAALLDEQHRRLKRKRRVEALVTAIVLFGSTGGGAAWFVQSPERVTAFKEAMRDIRSVGDVKSLVAKYQDALDRIGARGKQVEQATIAMGIKPTAADDEEDPYMDAEMKQMMGGEGKGKTIGERNSAMKKSFGDMAKKNGGIPKAEVALKSEESFEWNK
jgi:hypothetical protein